MQAHDELVLCSSVYIRGLDSCFVYGMGVTRPEAGLLFFLVRFHLFLLDTSAI